MKSITKVTRKGILLDLLNGREFLYGVTYSEPSYGDSLGEQVHNPDGSTIDMDIMIEGYFDLDELKSLDERYKDMAGDFYKHRRANKDWEDDWFLEDDRLDFYGMDDETFLEFLCFILHHDLTYGYVGEILKNIYSKLNRDGYEIKSVSKNKDGYEIFKGFKIEGGNLKLNFYTSVPSEYKTLIALNKAKPLPEYEGKKQYPYILLIYDNWDDFGNRTSFTCEFHLNKKTEISLGGVKVLDKKYKDYIEKYRHVILPTNFQKLGTNFCSVFTSDDIYIDLDKGELRSYKKTILKSLNDIFSDKRILNRFRKVEGFESSLLRDSEIYARVQNINEKLLSFGFKHEYGDLYFDFNEGNLPYRMNVAIGKNGTGKTTLLSNIAQELVEYKFEEGMLTNRPSFSKILQVSYSVFDNFNRPAEDSDFKYIYCGLRDEENKINILSLQERLNKSIEVLNKKGKSSIYTYLLKDLLDEENTKLETILENYSTYSSGQKILITILSEIVSNIEENSLILFDEPETHLHPNMIFKLMKVLYKLLDDNNSYGIIATHSPIVLQQIPSQSVNILDISGNRSLTQESFGQNFSNLTKEVFSDYEEEDIAYKDVFLKLSLKFNEKEIIEMFSNELNLNSRIYLRSIFNNKKLGEELKD